MTNHEPGQANQSKPFAPASVLPDPTRKKRSPLLWIGLGGAALFLCILTVLVGSLFVLRRNTDAPPATATTQPAVAAATNTRAAPSPTPPADSLPTNTSQPVTAQATATGISFGAICFRPTTATGDTMGCTTTFPPNVVEVHAVFDYSGLTPNKDTWTRIWYHNSQEVLKVEEKWTGDRSGQFDYNLNTSDGQPLSPGTWELELYANGQLLTYGAFVVEIAETPTPNTRPRPTPPPPSARKFTLAFTKWDGGKHSVWTANLDGTNQKFLLEYAASPSWSPDGKQLAFFGEQGIDHQPATGSGTDGIWKMNADGSAPVQLLPEGTAHTVAWSPDGQIIAFDGARGGPERRIYFINPDGAPQPFEALGEHPSFSPDGRQLVVKVCRPECGLWIENPDDAEPRQLTTEGSDGLPAWSPNGKKIAFSRNVDGNVDIYTINPDGSGLQRLTTAAGNDSVPAWTPDSRQIVFRSTRNGKWQIFIMNADGSNQRVIVDDVGASDEWAFDRMSVK